MKRWTRSDPTARTDRLTAVAPARQLQHSRPTTPGAPRQQPGAPWRPRTLRIPRVRKVILRDPVDQTCADQLESVLRGGGVVQAGAVLAEAVIGPRPVTEALWHHVLRAAAIALDDARRALTPTEQQASRALAASSIHCPRCTAAELCTTHQQVLWRWWDIRDTRALDVVNLTVAALAAGPPAPATAHQQTAQPASAGRARARSRS